MILQLTVENTLAVMKIDGANTWFSLLEGEDTEQRHLDEAGAMNQMDPILEKDRQRERGNRR